MPPRRRTPLLFAALLGVALAAVLLRVRAPSRPPAPPPAPPSNTDLTARFLALESSQTAIVQRDMAPELDAAPALDAISDLWDGLNQSADPLLHAAAQPLGLVHLARAAPSPPRQHPRIADAAAGLVGRSWDTTAWKAQLESWHSAGWRIRRTRWHLVEWTGSPPSARVTFEILAECPPRPARVQIRGEARITGGNGLPGPDSRIEVGPFECLGMEGPPDFVPAAEWAIPVPPHTPFCDPLLAVPRADRRGDDLLLVGAAAWFRNEPDGWRIEPLPGLPPERIWAAAVADWDRDGQPDLLLAGSEGLRWLAGPRWEGPGQPLWSAPSRLRHPQTLAVSDWDGDGDLDAWIGQYKLPYQGGQFPTPYHDANDGFESVLLRNDGPRGLTDVTDAAGLGGKRRRRLYSASFADWTDDGRPDLLLVSDFAGVDLFRNRGDGTFEDVTASLGTDRHLFGMAHVTGDFNDDGHTDLYVIGMDSPVASRLDRLGLHHREHPEDLRLRPAMTFGNRLFLGGPRGPAQAPWAHQLARGGWAWAVTPIDPDNAGQIGFHLCNGHETRASARDYERQFWLHDIHVGASSNNPVSELYFRNAAGRRAADKASYGGWQHGAFFVRTAPGNYSDLGWLLGTALFADTRNAVPIAFDSDGRMDLAITTHEQWPVPRQRLILLQNTTPHAGNWIGFEFTDRTGLDARIRVRSGGVTRERRLVTGESHRSEAAGRMHFGLGANTGMDAVELRLPDGGWKPVPTPRINHWNPIP